MKTVVMGLGSLLLAMVLTGCGTVEGFGKDLRKAGAVIQDAAKK